MKMGKKHYWLLRLWRLRWYLAVRKLEITAMEEITEAVEAAKVAGDIIIPAMILGIKAAIIEGKVL